MTCQDSVNGRQTEFEFSQQVRHNDRTEQCCGPLTTIGFTRNSMGFMHEAMSSIGMPEGYLDRYDPKMLDSTHMSLTMCPKHWMLHSKAISKLAEQIDSDALHQLAYFMFRYTCLSNDWDYKEIVNYASSIGASKPD